MVTDIQFLPMQALNPSLPAQPFCFLFVWWCCVDFASAGWSEGTNERMWMMLFTKWLFPCTQEGFYLLIHCWVELPVKDLLVVMEPVSELQLVYCCGMALKYLPKGRMLKPCHQPEMACGRVNQKEVGS